MWSMFACEPGQLAIVEDLEVPVRAVGQPAPELLLPDGACPPRRMCCGSSLRARMTPPLHVSPIPRNAVGPRRTWGRRWHVLPQLQPLVVPQDSQTWQAPARFILMPHSKHIGASWSTGTELPWSFGIGAACATACGDGAVGTAGSS
jgi:hypothetical protein